MEEEEIEYDSDHIDEETEARLYASVFYDNDTDEVTRCQSATLPTKFDRPSVSNNSLSDNTSEALSSSPVNKLGSDSFALVLQESSFKDPAIDSTLMKALYLTITGNTPHSVIQKAEERMDRYVEQNGADEHPVYTYATDTSSDSSFSAIISPKRPKFDLLLGISKQSLESLKKNKELLLEDLKDLPSDGKYWSLDSSDLSSLSWRKRRCRESDKTCERCFKKGHTWIECNRSGPLCYLCAQEGHTVRNCPNKFCSICNEFGHDSSRCRNKIRLFNTICSRCKRRGHESNICPDVWRQYKYTTQPGKPVVVTPSPSRRAKSCFNCGGRGHTGELCRKPTVDGRSAIPTSIFKFDDCDVYAEAAKNIQRSLIRSSYIRLSRTYEADSTSAVESTPKIRVFDEPLYCSLENGTSLQLSQPSPRRTLPLKPARWKKVQGEGKLVTNKSLQPRDKNNHWNRNSKAPRRRSLVNTKSRRYGNQKGGLTLEASNGQTLKNFRNHGALAKSRKRKHPESSTLRESSIRVELSGRNNHLSSPTRLKGGQRQQPTVRLRLEREDKRRRKNGIWRIEGDAHVSHRRVKLRSSRVQLHRFQIEAPSQVPK
ncbi:zinc finger CCHC domain containing protein 7 [Echinococcus multilocularis]|uniref:Zinc finger CCHC domain-containing protein 7 n=1 Tax=Echinococcus multilocularis TaxID=6211 RepID=A0A068Y671_ECHMU|nr:zinc finger CCHC domain containing protein 7 [Echinococcus multilocularis]